MSLRQSHFLPSVNSSVTNRNVWLELLRMAWVRRAGTQETPPRSILACRVESPESIAISKSVTAITRCGDACVCLPISDPGGIVTIDITHWSDEMRGSIVAHGALVV